MQKLRILMIAGSPKSSSLSLSVLKECARHLTVLGDCEVDMLDLSEEVLPAFNPDTTYTAPYFAALKDRVIQVDVLVLATPDYHGSYSSTLKNFLDHFWTEFTGKLFAAIVSSYEKGLTVHDHLRTIVRQCYAWSVPYGVSVHEKADFEGGRMSDQLAGRLEMLAHDLHNYGHLIKIQRAKDLAGTHPGYMANLRPKNTP